MFVSLSSTGSWLLPLATSNGSSNRSSRFVVSSGKGMSLLYSKPNKEQKKVVCACVATPRNLGSDELSSAKFNVIHSLFLFMGCLKFNFVCICRV